MIGPTPNPKQRVLDWAQREIDRRDALIAQLSEPMTTVLPDGTRMRLMHLDHEPHLGDLYWLLPLKPDASPAEPWRWNEAIPLAELCASCDGKDAPLAECEWCRGTGRERNLAGPSKPDASQS